MFATVQTPEWESRPVTRIKAWSSGEWMDYLSESSFLKSHLSEDELGRLIHARAVAWAVVDDKGVHVYQRPTLAVLTKAAEEGKLTEALAVYYQLLGERASVINRVANAAIKFHGIDGDANYETEKN